MQHACSPYVLPDDNDISTQIQSTTLSVSSHAASWENETQRNDNSREWMDDANTDCEDMQHSSSPKQMRDKQESKNEESENKK